MASDGIHLIGLWFDGQKYFASTLDKDCEERDDLPIFDETRRWLDIYFSGSAPDFTPALLLRANDFRRLVWEILLNIPYSRTMTYGEIARIALCDITCINTDETVRREQGYMSELHLVDRVAVTEYGVGIHEVVCGK